MQRGSPIAIHDLLPGGMSLDNVLVLCLAVGVLMVAWSIGQLFLTRDKLGPRLKMVTARRAELKGELTAVRHRKKLYSGSDSISLIRHIVTKAKLLQQLQVDGMQQKLVIAGYRGKDALTLYAFAKLLSPLFGLALGLLLCNIRWSDPFATSQIKGWFVLLLVTFVGTRLPDIWVSNARGKRQYSLRRALPDALDLMLVCAEAGLSLAAALDRVARELARMSPVLAEEFSLTSVELGFLPERAQALRNLADRTALREVRGFVNVILQTEKYGTPIAQALRVLAKEFRTERMLAAEQKAARLPALMTVPMIVFILPTLFIVVLTPAIIGVMDSM